MPLDSYRTLGRSGLRAPVIAVQLEYNLLERTSEGELIPMASALGLGVMPWGPLRSGFLSGKYSGAAAAVDTARGQLVGLRASSRY